MAQVWIPPKLETLNNALGICLWSENYTAASSVDENLAWLRVMYVQLRVEINVYNSLAIYKNFAEQGNYFTRIAWLQFQLTNNVHEGFLPGTWQKIPI